jgi:predicted phosphoribosyltransferase
MVFHNRAHAAGLLASSLEKYRGRRPLVLAIPRGAVPMGSIIAKALDGDLDVVLVRKLRAPENPELAVGSIDEKGRVYLDPDTRRLCTPEYLESEKLTQADTLRDRRRMYGRPAVDAAGRIAIVVDDGIATGSTMIAALRAVRAQNPSRLVAAVGVAPAETLLRMRAEADEVVCLDTPAVMFAVGSHFREFPQVSDDEVTAALEASGTGAGSGPRRADAHAAGRMSVPPR